MNKLEIIRRILEKKFDESVTNLLQYNDDYNLTYLCTLNKKYLTEENLNFILNTKKIKNKYILNGIKINLLKNYNYNVALLLSKYPYLIKKLDNNIINNIDVYNWSNIIKEQPTLIGNCEIIYKFKDTDWFNILSKQPDLISKCKGFYDLKESLINTLIYNSNYIINYIDINKIKLNSYNLSNIIKIYPEFINKVNINQLNEILESDWVKILQTNPKLIKFCHKKDEVKKYLTYNISILIELISKQPYFKNLLPENLNIKTNNIKLLVLNQPQLIDELKLDIKKFTTKDWCEILQKRPELISKCDKLHDIIHNEWRDILSKQPKLKQYCDKFNEFSEFDWFILLSKQPSLIDKCKYSSFNEQNKINLLINQPSLIKYLNLDNITNRNINGVLYNSKEYRFETVNKYIELHKDPEVLTNMIGIYPDLKDLYTENNLWKYVDFNKLSENLEYSILK